jgi:methyltransferase
MILLIGVPALACMLLRTLSPKGPEVAHLRHKRRSGAHALWLAGLWLFGWARPLSLIWLACFLVLQVLRFWTLMTLGRRWTTRIIVLPGAPIVANGPYRFVSHPNYLVVAGEIAVLPLCLGLPWLALAFSVANVAILSIRIRAENAALIGLRYVDCA